MSSARRVLLPAFLATVAVSCSTWAQDVGNLYAVNCANCHGADGRGNTALGRAMKLRDLRSPEVRRLSEGELLGIVSKGADRGRMPGFEKKLGAEAVRKLAAYVRDIDLRPVPVPQIRKTAGSETSSDNGDVKSVYSAKCSHCHGADGAGNTALGRALRLRDMRSPEAQKFSDDEVIAIIASGTDGGRMPGFRKKLGSEMVEQLAAYVRTLSGKAPVTATNDAIGVGTGGNPESPEAAKPAVAPEDRTLAAKEPENQPEERRHRAEATKNFTWTKLRRTAISANQQRGQTPELVDLNSATKQTLMTLPGITEADAASIVAGRPYKSVLQFKTRHIVGPATYGQIADRIIAKQPARRK